MDVRIEDQADNRDADNRQQDTARHFQFFEADNHRQPDQRHNHREAIKITQRHRQTIQRIFNHQAHAVGGNQQQEQTDTNPRTVRHALRQVTQDPATNAGRGDHGEQDTHQEHRAQRDRNADLLTQYQAKGGKRGQGDGAANRQRQVRPQPHHQRADAGNQTGGNKYRSRWKTRFAEHTRHHDDGVNHRQEGGKTGNDFLTHGAAASRNFKPGVQ